MPTIEVPLEDTYKKSIARPVYQSRVCESRVQGIDCGPEISEWLSLALGKPNLRLIRQSYGRQKKGTMKKSIEVLLYEYIRSQNRTISFFLAGLEAELSFSSQAQYLLINNASVSWLIDKVSNDSDFKKNTAVHRFRGNIIVENCDAFDEMQWQHIRIGDNNFKV